MGATNLPQNPATTMTNLTGTPDDLADASGRIFLPEDDQVPMSDPADPNGHSTGNLDMKMAAVWQQMNAEKEAARQDRSG